MKPNKPLLKLKHLKTKMKMNKICLKKKNLRTLRNLLQRNDNNSLILLL